MGENPTIAFRVSEGQKENWDQYAKQKEEYDSLSHLIRVAVAHEMSDAYGPLSESGGSEDTGSNKVLHAVKQLEAEIEDFGQQVDDATRYLYASEGPNFTFTLRVFEELNLSDAGPPDEQIKAGKTVDEIADDLGISKTGKIDLALKTLQHETNMIQWREKEGETLYWRIKA